MSKNIFVIPLFVLMFMSSYAFSEVSYKDDEIKSATANAWQKFNNGEYASAREIVDKYYDESQVYLSLLSAVLYTKENDCRNALKAIKYVEGYYDEHQEELKKASEGVLNAYINYKKIGMKCNHELENWDEFISDAKKYLELADEEDVYDIIAMLGLAHKKNAMLNIQNSINAYSKVVNSDATLDLKEDAYFQLTYLYSINGHINKSVDNAKSLLKKTKNKKKWVVKMKESPELKLILMHEKIKSLLK